MIGTVALLITSLINLVASMSKTEIATFTIQTMTSAAIAALQSQAAEY